MSILKLNNAEQVRQFTQTIKLGKSVSVKATGEWKLAGVWQRVVEWFSGKEKRFQKITNIFTQQLDRLERKAVKFKCSDAEQGAQKALYSSWMKGVTLLQNKVNGRKKLCKATRVAFTQLQISVVGLKYRIEKVNGGLNQQVVGDKAHKAQLREAILEWKRSEDGYKILNRWKESVGKVVEELTPFDEEKIEQIAQYPAFVDLIMKNPELRVAFFKWGIRDNNNIRPFIQFPAIYQRIYRSLLTGRFGIRAPENMLSIDRVARKQGRMGERKILRFVFNSEKINLLNEKKPAPLENGWTPTVGEVLDECKAKNDRPGRIEIFEGVGFSNWNVHEWGRWNPNKRNPKTGKMGDYDRIDLKDNWWEKLPVQETLSKEDLEKRYGLDPIAEGQWVGFANASRISPDLDVDESHGYLGVAIPQPGGRYRLYDFGKFAESFPTGSKARTMFIGGTFPAKLAGPDENHSYGQRQIASKPFVLDPAKGLKLMQIITKYAIKAREGNLIFQFAWENCAFFPDSVFKELFEGKMPSLFKTSITAATPSNKVLKVCFNIMRGAPKWVQWVMRYFIEIMLKGWRGVTIVENGKRVKKSALRSPFHKTGDAFLPALLHEKILKGEVKGKIFFGHQSKVPGRS